MSSPGGVQDTSESVYAAIYYIDCPTVPIALEETSCRGLHACHISVLKESKHPRKSPVEVETVSSCECAVPAFQSSASECFAALFNKLSKAWSLCALLHMLCDSAVHLIFANTQGLPPVQVLITLVRVERWEL